MLLWGVEPPSWNYSTSLSLKKDEVALYEITDIENQRNDWNISFRWTLVKQNGAVMLYDVNHFKSQNILYSGMIGADTHRLIWRERKEGSYERPSFWIVFKGYNENNKTAAFDILVRDRDRQIEVNQRLPRMK